MQFDYRETKEGQWRFKNKELYQKTVQFQNLMAENGIAWHNAFSDECTFDFGCCTGLGNYHTYFPAYSQVLKDEALNKEIGKIQFNGTWYSHPKTNTYKDKNKVIEELINFKQPAKRDAIEPPTCNPL